jgi:hypothetical protein
VPCKTGSPLPRVSLPPPAPGPGETAADSRSSGRAIRTREETTGGGALRRGAGRARGAIHPRASLSCAPRAVAATEAGHREERSDEAISRDRVLRWEPGDHSRFLFPPRESRNRHVGAADSPRALPATRRKAPPPVVLSFSGRPTREREAAADSPLSWGGSRVGGTGPYSSGSRASRTVLVTKSSARVARSHGDGTVTGPPPPPAVPPCETGRLLERAPYSMTPVPLRVSSLPEVTT